MGTSGIVLNINRLIIAYLLIASMILLCAPAQQKHYRTLYCMNALALICFAYPLLYPIHTRWMGILYDWLPLILLPLFHYETDYLTTAYGRKTYDAAFIRFERKHFTWLMRFHRRNMANKTSISELLHACYFSFYGLLYAVPGYFYWQQAMPCFYQSVFAILLLLFLCFLTHSLIPVSGPRTIFTKINDKRSQGLFFRLVHKVLEGGSTHATAFPSGHTGIATVTLLMSWCCHTYLFWILLPIALGLILSTLYGRFHYLSDLLCGFGYGVITVFITRSIYQ